jgi:hypothetical protein
MADVAATFVQMLLDIPEQNGGGLQGLARRREDLTRKLT